LKRFVLSFILCLTASFGQQWSIGYWPQFGTPIPVSKIQWDGLTHVVQGEALVNTDGTLDLSSFHFAANAPQLLAAAHSANVKVLVGLEEAYWWGQTNNLQQAVTTHLAELVSNVANLVNTYGFDGIDIDWEPFDPLTNGPAMTTFLQALRAKLPQTVITASAEVNHYAYWGTPAKYLDRINVMTYDMAGLWDKYSWHNSALYANSSDVWSVDLAVQRFTKGGVPAAKLGIGIPFYGYQWIGGGIWGPNQYWSPAPDRQQIAYNQMFSRINTQNVRWDFTAQVPYLTNDAGTPSFLSYDDEKSIAAKVNYAKNMGLGGWIIWQLSLDYFPDRNPQHPLMTAIRNAMGVAPAITSSSPLPAASWGKSYSQTLTASGTTPITWNVIAGALPAGLALGPSTGIISGTPSSAGTFPFTLQIGNSAGIATRPFSLTVSTPPVITSASALPPANLGTSYSQTLTATGSAPITWNLTAGTLPAGLILGPSTGIISGTPSSAGTFTFTLMVTNPAGIDTRPFSLIVSKPPVVNLLGSPSDITTPLWLWGGTGASKTNAKTFHYCPKQAQI
jgi:chitinase